jgi:Chromo (CHRromatin Organisation MOdifier) domain
MKTLQEKASLSLTQATKLMKDNYDRHCSPSQNLQIGEHVWLKAINIHMKRPMKKLNDKHLGPFLILEKIGKSTFKLDIPQSWKHHPVFNKALLTQFIPASFNGQDIPRPPPELDEEGIAVYKVKSIIDKWKKGQGIQYLVKWKGYPHLENTLEPASSLAKAQDAIHDFRTKSA